MSAHRLRRTPRWGRTAALGALVLAAAIVFDAEPLYVVGVAFLALGLGAAALVAGAARGARVSRELALARTLEGQPVQMRLRAARNLRPGVGAELHDALLDEPLAVPGGRRRALEATRSVSFPRRGEHDLEPPALVLSDPLGLARRTVRARDGNRILVLPRLAPVEISGLAGAGLGRISQPLRRGDAETELDGLRAYRPGTPASRMFWPALARGAGLVERRMRGDEGAGPVVVLDTSAASGPDAVDAAVRAAASLCFELARRGGCGLLLPGDRRPVAVRGDGAGWRAAHGRLARVPDGASARLSAARAADPLVLVCARPVARPPAALPSGTGAVVLVVPGELPGRTAALRVAGCSGYVLGAGGRAGARQPVEERAA